MGEEDVMRRKIGTILDEDVINRAKMVAAAEGRSLAQVVEEALRVYLAHRVSGASSTVMQTMGLVKGSRSQVGVALSVDPYDR